MVLPWVRILTSIPLLKSSGSNYAVVLEMQVGLIPLNEWFLSF